MEENNTQVATDPGSGASKASDFQPLTQNPQSDASAIQQNSNGLQPSPEHIGISQQNLPTQFKLEATSSPAEPVSDNRPTTQPGGINWFAIILITFVIASTYYLLKRAKSHLASS